MPIVMTLVVIIQALWFEARSRKWYMVSHERVDILTVYSHQFW